MNSVGDTMEKSQSIALEIGDIVEVEGYGREGIVINVSDEYCYVHWFDNDYNSRYILPHHHTALTLLSSSNNVSQPLQ
jgi:hypothetical protein